MRLEVEELEQRKNIDRLVRDLNNNDVHVRRRSAEALGKFADAASVKPLIECLSDSDENVHKWAAVALGKLVQPLAEWLSDCEGDVRCFATIAIGMIRVVDVSVKPLIECLSNSDKYVRKWTAFALGGLAMAGVYDAASVKPMVKLLVDHDRGGHWVVVAYRELVYAASVKPLIECLIDSDEDVCKGSVWALGDLADVGIYDSASMKPLIERIADSDGNVRKEDVWAVLKELDDSDDEFASARPLAKLPVCNGVPAITIRDLANAGVYNAAPAELLTKLLTNYNADVRYCAAVALKELADAGVTNIPPDNIISAVINDYHTPPPSYTENFDEASARRLANH